MPVEPILALIVIVVVANVLLMGVIALPPVLRALRARAERAAEAREAVRLEAVGDADLGAPTAVDDFAIDGSPRSAYDRLIRVAAITFILFTLMLVSLQDLWPGTRPGIVLLLAVAGLLVLLFHDVLPTGWLGRAGIVIEGLAVLAGITLLITLTGGAESPFFFIYALVVVGAALVISSPLTVVFSTVASLTYALVAVVLPLALGEALESGSIARVGVEVVALSLLSYIAAYVAREQRRARDAAVRLSTLDSLTDLYNRSYFVTALEREIARSDRSGRAFSVLMMDLDGLKSINDQYGHFVGDRVLRGVGDVVRRGVRRIDTPARYGGDEFVVILPETDTAGAFVLAEKIRQQVAERVYDTGHRGSRRTTEQIRASVSVGVVSYPTDGRSLEELMISADKAMYASKRGGKNRVIDYATARGATGAAAGGAGATVGGSGGAAASPPSGGGSGGGGDPERGGPGR